MPMAHHDELQRMRSAHRTRSELVYDAVEIDRGYAGRWLRVDLSKNEITIHPVTEQMKALWTGGKGFDLWISLLEISESTRWDSPENPICFSSGPLGGTTSFPGSGKTLCTAVSPLTGILIDCNVGGYFGPFLKFAGFDALCLTGKASEESIVVIDATSRRIAIETAPLESVDSHVLAEELTAMYARDELDLRNVAVVSAGRGAEHSRMGVLNFSFWDWRRRAARLKQAGRGGIGTVLRDKQLKALVVKNRGITPAWRVAESKVERQIAPKTISRLGCPHEVEELRGIIRKWGSDPEFVIEMLQDVQERFRHIPKTALETICLETRVPEAYLYHIATFYKAFSLEPRGEMVVQVCMGTACHVKGAARILDSFERVLGVEAGKTTADGRFSLEPVACLGACSIAPVVKLGDEVVGNVQARNVERLIKKASAKLAAEKAKTAAAAASEAGSGGNGDGAGGNGDGSGGNGGSPGNGGEGHAAGGAGHAASAVGPRPAWKRLLPADLDTVAAEERARAAGYKSMLMVCTGTGCVSANGFTIRDNLESLLAARGLSRDYLVVPTGCNGFCAMGPIVVVQPEGTFYQKVGVKDLEEIIDTHLLGGQPVARLLHADPVTGAVGRTAGEIGFFSKQQLIALRNKGLVDPENIDHYIARGGYAALRKAVTGMRPEEVIHEIIRSGLRGRGGGGFPAGVKWESALKAKQARNEVAYIVCNGDEGDPGAFMDRSIIETDPHAVIEGMLIGAFAVGATEGFIYIRKEYPLAMDRLHIALDQARARGLLGEDILGTGMRFDIKVHRGAGAFVCGESTALMASMSGRAGEPRAKYVHNVEYGYRDKPTVLNNVETWANVPVILEKGGAWFASIGTGDVSENPWNGSSGTKVFSLVGDIRNTGLVEVPMGIRLREIIEDIGGGIPNGRRFKAVQTGGPSGGCLPESLLDMPVDFDSLTEAGSMMGSGGMIVMDDHTCMVDVARYFIDFLVDESCGKCTPCREGLAALSHTLARICRGAGREEDLAFLEELSETVRETSLCQLGGSAPNPVLSTLRYFREEYLEHIREKRCRAGVCKELITYSIDAERCDGCAACGRACPNGAITGEPRKTHAILYDKCIKCGICIEVCKRGAVEVH